MKQNVSCASVTNRDNLKTIMISCQNGTIACVEQDSGLMGSCYYHVREVPRESVRGHDSSFTPPFILPSIPCVE